MTTSTPFASAAATPAPALAALPATHMTIVASFDSSVTTSPIAADYESAASTAIQYFENAITTAVTLTIDFGWGETQGLPFSGVGQIARSRFSVLNVTYSQLYDAVQALPNKSAVQQTAFATLPSTDPTGGFGTIDINPAQAVALGLPSGTSADTGWVGLNNLNSFFWSQSAPQQGSYDAVSFLEHEISEVLGRRDVGGANNAYTLLDFFRYTAADGGIADPPGSAAGQRNQPFDINYNPFSYSYFSANGQTVALPYDGPSAVAAGADVGDWASSVTNDAFGAPSPGVVGSISTTDLEELNVAGYSLACFAAGTTILTATGPVRVEHLTVGIHLPTASGRLARIAWLGHRSVEPQRHPRPYDINPIRIRAHALGSNLPTRDLILSPDHALLIDDVLIPIRHLANGTSIAQEPRARINYFHVELDRHDAILAEGLACETYLDTANRDAFEGQATTQLRPDFAQRHAERVWAERGCAPILTEPSDATLRRHHTSLLVTSRRAA